MLPYDQMVLAMSALRDQLITTMQQHERRAHGGAPCMGNRASAIAYLAHCLGVRDDAWHYAATLRQEYDAHCVGDQCPHPHQE